MRAPKRELFRDVLADSFQIGSIHSPPQTDSTPGLKDERANIRRAEESPSSSPVIEFDEVYKEKFDLMNINIVIYGLNGVMCEKELTRKRLFGRSDSALSAIGDTSRRRTMGFSESSISSGDLFSASEADCMDNNVVPTTAVVSCQKNAISSRTSLETFLPSLPIQRPIATFVYKVRYAAAWPSQQSILQQDSASMDRSSFQIIRCMQQISFVPGIGVGSNHLPETVELRINLSRGTQLIRLGTASIIINGDEEGEVKMNVPAKPTIFDAKKLKKKKNKCNKYGYFSDDPSRRYFLDENATLRIGVKVIPEEAVRFAKEKEKTRREQELQYLLEKDDLKELLRQMGNDNLDRPQKLEIIEMKVDPCVKNAAEDLQEDRQERDVSVHQRLGDEKRMGSMFPDLFCGAVVMPKIAGFCAATPFMQTQAEPEIPMEIRTDQDLDKFAIASIISSVSESNDGSFLDPYDE